MHLHVLKVIITFPIRTICSNIVDLAFDELVSYLSHCREIIMLLLENHENHSSTRWRQRGCFLLAIVQTCPFQVRITSEMTLAVSMAIKLNRIMTFRSIWSFSRVVFSSPDHTFEVIEIVIQSIVYQINHSSENFYFSKILVVTQFKNLVSELELEAIGAVKLMPQVFVRCLVLPGPI